MSDHPATKMIAALNRSDGLRDDFIYYSSFEDYAAFAEPFPRACFAVREVQESILRYPNPDKPGELFRWDIHGRLLTPDKTTLANTAIVMIHGGAANEYEFLFTPDGPEEFVDLTKTAPNAARVGVAQHIASLGVPVLAISLPGHFSRKPGPPIATRRPEFVIDDIPSDRELEDRLAVFTFRMCVEAIKKLIESHLPNQQLYIWGHSTGGEYFYLMEQYGLKNRLLGGLGFGTGMPAWLRKEWDLAADEKTPEQRGAKFARITDLSRRSPRSYEKSGYVGPNQPWGAVERWFELENHRRPQFKPYLQDIEHSAYDYLRDEIGRKSGLPDEELFVTFKADLNNLRGKKMLHFVGELDKGHWIDGEEKGLDFRREVFALRRFAEYADAVRLVVIPRLTHYGHVEAHNERLANMMVTAMRDYFPSASAPAGY
jgi:hypothetical protein